MVFKSIFTGKIGCDNVKDASKALRRPPSKKTPTQTSTAIDDEGASDGHDDFAPELSMRRIKQNETIGDEGDGAVSCCDNPTLLAPAPA